MQRLQRLALHFTIFVAVYGTVLASSHLLGDVKTSTAAEGLLPMIPVKASTLFRDVAAWFASYATEADMPQAERLALIRAENEWKNSLVMWMVPEEWAAKMPSPVQAWFRCWVLCMAVYFAVGAVWSYYIYFCFGDRLFAPGTIPALKDVVEQIRVSSLAMPLYAWLPALGEYAAEQGWTKAYPRVANVGLPAYVVYFFLYMASVEFGVYWMHRMLHWGWMYKYLHYDHHKYNKEHTMSPFAGLAFNPIDGILQAVPYTWTMLYVPTHFITHEILLFATGVWTANIHDNLHARLWPIMGAGYHTIHHTSYKHNYGHYFTLMDWLFGTLETPEEHEAARAASTAGAKGVKAQ